MRRVNAQDMALSPTVDSLSALAEARQRRRIDGYTVGDSIVRKLAEPAHLPSPDRSTILRRAGVGERDWGMSFERCERLDEESYRDWRDRAQREGRFCVVPANVDAFEWVSAWTPAEGSCYLEGQVGRGKSLLAAAAAERLLTIPVCLTWDAPRRARRRTGGVSVVWTDETALARAQRSHRRHRQLGSVSPIRRAAECAVLVLDDFLAREGAAKGYRQEDADEDLEYLLNARYAANLPVFVTSNLPLSAVADARGARVASRLFEMCAGFSLAVGGPDWRRV